MLSSLAIRDIVLIERLELALGPGLCVFTGETGAGKSILLDALGLALGGRAERGLVRQGAAHGAVVAEFALAPDDPAHDLLAEHGIAPEETLVLRRTLSADGRSRAFVNDQPVGTALLRRLGELLVEVHGQHEQQGLLEAGVQRRLLDAFGQLEPPLAEVRAAHGRWREAERAHAELSSAFERAALEERYLRHAAAELDQLAPEAGEEAALAERRARLMNREKLIQAIREALAHLGGEGGALSRLGSARRLLERAAAGGEGLLGEPAAAVERALVEAGEAAEELQRGAALLDGETGRLEQIEERLFALRAAARKHRVEVEALPALRAELTARLATIDAGGERLVQARRAAEAARADFVLRARGLGDARAAAAGDLGRAVMAELPPLKLEKARFQVRLLPLAEPDWSAEGCERVLFEVATNPGQDALPLSKIASGGELARLMLALKVVLARVSSTPCLVFDEIDAGIGGATADAVGLRLARLGEAVQVLVVTHAPQVAARAGQHLRVKKRTVGERASVVVTALGADARREEVARMLAGAQVTEAARAAADSLITRSA